MAEPGRVNRPGDQPHYRVGRRCPWNVYRINPDDDDRDDDDRFAVAIGPGAPADGPLVAAALNAYTGSASLSTGDLREQLREYLGYGETADAAMEVVGPVLAVKDAEIEQLRTDFAEECHHRDFLWWLYAEAEWTLGQLESAQVAELREMVDRRDYELAAIGRVIASVPEGDDEAMSLSNRVRQAFNAVTARANEARVQVAGLTRHLDSTYRRADEQTKAAIDWEKRYRATQADLQGARAQLGKTDELHEALMAELTRERDEGRAEIREQAKERARVVMYRDAALNLAAEILGEFFERGHPGEPCLRSGWVPESRMDEWRAKIKAWRPVAQEAGEPREHADDCQGCEQIPGAVHCSVEELPRRPRVWQKGDPEPEGVDVVRTGSGRKFQRGHGIGPFTTSRPWVAVGDPPQPAYSWDALTREHGPLTEVPSGGDPDAG